MQSQTEVTNDSSRQNTELSTAIADSSKAQLQLAKHTMDMQKAESKKNRMAFVAGFQLLARALNPNVDISLPFPIDSDSE
mmetsp:Transcript_31035/g.87947  ORF Transcript_31035/g.87947 Transcript_31035/m.87947 type:complete len:80 (+) Transcript_31035:1152-1391(+)